jgi:hypothetical protein
VPDAPGPWGRHAGVEDPTRSKGQPGRPRTFGSDGPSQAPPGACGRGRRVRPRERPSEHTGQELARMRIPAHTWMELGQPIAPAEYLPATDPSHRQCHIDQSRSAMTMHTSPSGAPENVCRSGPRGAGRRPVQAGSARCGSRKIPQFSILQRFSPSRSVRHRRGASLTWSRGLQVSDTAMRVRVLDDGTTRRDRSAPDARHRTGRGFLIGGRPHHSWPRPRPVA